MTLTATQTLLPDLEPSPSTTATVTQWLAARARNALRRPLRIIGVSSTAFIAALLTLILIPHAATRRAELLDQTRARPDTAAMQRRIDQLRLETADVERALLHDRVRRLAYEQAVRESLLAWHGYPEGATRRDSLVADRVELGALIARATRSPLPTSYRGLAGARALAKDSHVRVLLDSLAALSRSRDAIASGGRADPVYLALTARVTSIGRTIEGIATARAAVLDAEIAKIPPPPSNAEVDTMPARMRVDSVHRVAARAGAALAGARRLDVMLDAQAERARVAAAGSAPPLALMAAALVLGLAVGFAVTFGTELATPRVSDAREASRVAGVPTLATVVPHVPDPQRMRRKTDREVSTLIDVNSESYRFVYLSVSGRDAAVGLGFPLVAVTGDEAEVVGTVAANIAVASAHDSRTTLLIDADPKASVVAGILGVRRAPGVSDVLAGQADWSGIVVSAVVGRDRMLNVMPAGAMQPVSLEVSDDRLQPAPDENVPDVEPLEEDVGAPLSAAGRELRAELIRLGRRYDLVVVAAPARAAQVGPDSILPVRDALVCARIAYTPLARLTSAVATLRDSRLRVRGIVLWDADVPPRLSEG